MAVSQSHHWPTHAADDGRGDDLIGWTDTEVPLKETEAALPLVCDQLVATMVLSSGEPGVNCAGWDRGDQSFTCRVTRVPDCKDLPRFQVAEGKPRTGAAAERDAVLVARRLVPDTPGRRIDRDEMGEPEGVWRDRDDRRAEGCRRARCGFAKDDGGLARLLHASAHLQEFVAERLGWGA